MQWHWTSLVDDDGFSGRGKPAASPPFPAPPQTWRTAAGSGLPANGADFSAPSLMAATPPRFRSTTASLTFHLFFYWSSNTTSGSHWRSPLLPAARSPQHRDPPQQESSLTACPSFLLGFGTNVTQFVEREGGRNQWTFKDFNNKNTKEQQQPLTDDCHTQNTKSSPGLVLSRLPLSSFYPSGAPPWDSKPVSGAGVIFIINSTGLALFPRLSSPPHSPQYPLSPVFHLIQTSIHKKGNFNQYFSILLRILSNCGISQLRLEFPSLTAICNAFQINELWGCMTSRMISMQAAHSVLEQS